MLVRLDVSEEEGESDCVRDERDECEEEGVVERVGPSKNSTDAITPVIIIELSVINCIVSSFPVVNTDPVFIRLGLPIEGPLNRSTLSQHCSSCL